MGGGGGSFLVNTFGVSDEGAVLLAPEGLDVEARTLENIRYRLNAAREMGLGHLIPMFEKWRENARAERETPRIAEEAFAALPEAGISS